MRWKRWRDLSGAQKATVVSLGALQMGLAGVALTDLAHRPPAAVRGKKLAWAAFSLVDFVGPIAYLLFGRRRRPVRKRERTPSATAHARGHHDPSLTGFDRTVQETYHWLGEIAKEMDDGNRKAAYHALRGVLFALRDRLPVNEALDLAAQLPMLIRGIFFEGYRIEGKPVKYHRDGFLRRVRREMRQAGIDDTEDAVRAVMVVMERHLSVGEMQDVRQTLPTDIRRLWPQPHVAVDGTA